MAKVEVARDRFDMVSLDDLSEDERKFLQNFDDRFRFIVSGTTCGNRITVTVLYTPDEFYQKCGSGSVRQPTGYELNLGVAHVRLGFKERLKFEQKIMRIVASAKSNEVFAREHGYPYGKEWIALKPRR
jgi:hypothetical protein